MSYNVMSKNEFREIARDLNLKPDELLHEVTWVLAENHWGAILAVKPEELMIISSTGKERVGIANVVFRAAERIQTKYSEAF